MEVTFPNMPDSSDLALELEQATHVKNQLNGFSVSYSGKKLGGVKTEHRTIKSTTSLNLSIFTFKKIDLFFLSL